MRCDLCPHRCELQPGQTGLCHARANRAHALTSLSYGRLTSLALDPIEKKPLARFRPGSLILSAGSFGCNMRCPFCQNSDISFAGESADTFAMSPETLVAKAVALIPEGNIGLAYTYNEPFVNFEYMRDCAVLARQVGLVNVAVTNGMVCAEPLRAMLPNLHAMNIDLKSFTEEGYRRLGGDLTTVKATISASRAACHVEVTTLIVPGLNDDEGTFQSEVEWLAALDHELPLHITRFFPRYRMTDRPPTPLATLQRFAEIARSRLRYVYLGNC